MSTKPDTETGWSKEFPTIDGHYWVRFIGYGSPTEAELRTVVGHECRTEFSVFTGSPGSPCNEWEFLGPIFPSNFEQLLRLRKIAEGAL